MSQGKHVSNRQTALHSNFHLNSFHEIAALGWHVTEELSVKQPKSRSTKHRPVQTAPHVITQNLSGRGRQMSNLLGLQGRHTHVLLKKLLRFEQVHDWTSL